MHMRPHVRQIRIMQPRCSPRVRLAPSGGSHARECISRDGCYTFFAFPPVGSDFPYASPGNIVRTNTYVGARARGKLTSREGSIDALSPVRPETPSRNKPAREEDDGAAR